MKKLKQHVSKSYNPFQQEHLQYLKLPFGYLATVVLLFLLVTLTYILFLLLEFYY